MMITNKLGKPVSQRQLRVGEMIKQSLGMIFLRNEAKVPNLETNTITVTEVKMSQDLKTAKAFVLPLGGKNAEETVNILKEFSFLIRKVLSKKITIKFLPKILFAKDESFDYAEKIENLSKHIKQFQKDKHSSVGLLRAVNRRKKLLDYLKINKIDSYKNVLTKLNLRK